MTPAPHALRWPQDGVYYGFKMGRPVPWSSAFPFNLGFRHPQYVGAMLTSSECCCSSRLQRPFCRPRAARALVAALLLADDWMEASGDNDKAD